LNRLQSASSTSTHATNATNCWGEKYGIDAWGNLNSVTSLSSAYTGCTQEPTFSTTANARNRLPITGNTYDSAGNVITAPVGGITNSYSYNADNQMQSMTGLTTTTNYVYDGDGKRVQKTGSKLYWYGADGSVLDETDTTGSVTNATFSEYIFVGGRRMARRDSGGNVLYYFADHLGTSRTMAQVASGQTTATLCYDADFYPFGGERTVVNLCGQNYKFTGKERDQESGLDEFGARYYSGGFGRFMIPDWAAKPTDVPYANFGNPQSLNLYSYVQNNPTTLGDPDGHCSDDNKSDPCQPPPKSASQNAPPPPKKPFIPPAPFLKPNPTFKTAKQAGAAAARADQQRQKQTGFEHGSSAFKVANGVYTYTDPITQGDKYGVDPHNTTGVPDATTNFRDAPIPLGTQLTGEAHSHPGNDGFSGDDIQRGHDMRTPYYGHPEFEGAYVGLQNGSVIRYDVGTGHQTVFPPGEPQ
jgi:RHS repeat-associated protein